MSPATRGGNRSAGEPSAAEPREPLAHGSEGSPGAAGLTNRERVTARLSSLRRTVRRVSGQLPREDTVPAKRTGEYGSEVDAL